MRALELLGGQTFGAPEPFLFLLSLACQTTTARTTALGENLSPLRILVDLVNYFHNFIATHCYLFRFDL